MSAPPLIRKLLAGLLLLVFAFGITPKRTLHNIIATHKDAKEAVRHDHPGACVSKAVFNCQCDNLVSESPFVAVVFSVAVTSTLPVSVYAEPAGQDMPGTGLFGYHLRGPPAC